MVNAIGTLVLRPDPLRHALYRLYDRLPRGIGISLEMWSDDLTFGRLIKKAEQAGDWEALDSLQGEACMERSILEDERLQLETWKLTAIARRHMIALPIPGFAKSKMSALRVNAKR